MPEISQKEAQALLLKKRAEIANTPESSESITSRPSKPEVGPCRQCGQPLGIEPQWVEVLGRWITPPSVCDACVKISREAEAERERKNAVADRANRMPILLRASGVGEKHVRDLSGLSVGIPQIAQGFLEKWNGKPGLFIFGGFGRGKTLLAAKLMQQLILRLANPKMVTVPRVLLEIKRSFDAGAEDTEFDIVNKYSSIFYLFLDDLGAEKTTEYVLQTLYLILDKRYIENLPTVITSNLSLEEIEARFGGRIASRIAGMCEFIELGGKDRRL